MTPRHERRAAALEAIAHALLELAAVEREPEAASSPAEVLVDRRNCERELGVTPHTFVGAAGRHFPAFRVSRRLTATKADVLTWLKSRRVQPKHARPAEAPAPPDPDAFLKAVNAKFLRRVGRPMTDEELSTVEIRIIAGRDYAKAAGREYETTPDEIAARVEGELGEESFRHRDWRSHGLDPAEMDRKAADLRERINAEHPEWDWRQRQRAVEAMWRTITEPLDEARRRARAEKRAAKKAERA